MVGIEFNDQAQLFGFENILTGIFEVLFQNEFGKGDQGTRNVPNGGVVLPQV